MTDVVDELKAAAFIKEALEVMTPRLMAACELDSDQARDLARDLLHDVCAEVGGRSVYLPRDLLFGMTDRDRQIFELHNGRNTTDLAKRFGVTDTRIRQIAKAILLERRAKLQPQLPGLDGQ